MVGGTEPAIRRRVSDVYHSRANRPLVTVWGVDRGVPLLL
jgi:hypothetical protein